MRRRRRSLGRLLTLWLCSLAAALGPRRGQSQSTLQGSIDAGVATLRQRGDTTSTIAPMLAGELRSDGTRFALRAAGGATLAASNRWAAQGDASASWIAAATARAAWELGATASALRFNNAPAAASAALVARHHEAFGRAGAWVGGSAGVLTRQGRAGVPLGAVEGGAWIRASALRASLGLALQRTRLDTVVTYQAQGGGTASLPPTSHGVTALDATALAEWRGRRVDLEGTAVLRRAPAIAHGVLGSVYVTGARWLAPRVAVTAAAGSLAADPLHGFPARRVASLGLRWRLGAPRVLGATRSATPAADVVVRGEQRVLRVRAPSATGRVEVRGDFTRWQPVALTRVGDAWELPLALPPGAVHVALRLDGGAWIAPANVPSVEDEFGERSGLLVVP